MCLSVSLCFIFIFAYFLSVCFLSSFLPSFLTVSVFFCHLFFLSYVQYMSVYLFLPLLIYLLTLNLFFFSSFFLSCLFLSISFLASVYICFCLSVFVYLSGYTFFLFNLLQIFVVFWVTIHYKKNRKLQDFFLSACLLCLFFSDFFFSPSNRPVFRLRDSAVKIGFALHV